MPSKLAVSVIATVAILSACADPPVTSVTRTPATDPPAPQAVQEVSLRIFGRGASTEFFIKTHGGEVHGVSSFVAGSPEDLPVGVQRDTLFQFLFRGYPDVGDRELPVPTIHIKHIDGKAFLMTGTVTANGSSLGTPDLMLFIWPRGASAPVEELVQSEPATVTITEYVAPDANKSNGMLRGHVTFVADRWIREWKADGTSTLRNSGEKVRIAAQFSASAWENRVERIDATSSGS